MNAIQDKIKNIYYEKIVPRLDNLFSDFIKDDTVIRLDKLDINVGTINEDDLEKQLIEKIIKAIKQQLESSFQFDVKDSQNVQLQSGGQSVIDAFLYFLRQGYFPWWSSINNLSALEAAVIKQYKADKDLPAKILQLINADSNATARLNFQFSKQFRRFIVEEIFVFQDVTTQTFLRRLFLQDEEINTIKNDVQPSSNKDEIIENKFDDDASVNKHHKKNTEEDYHQQQEKEFDEYHQNSSQSSTTKKDKQQSKNELTEFSNQHTVSQTTPLSVSDKNKQAIDEQSSMQSERKQDDIENDNPLPANEEKTLQQANNASPKKSIEAETNDIKNENISNNEADVSINQKQIEKENVFADKTYQQKSRQAFDRETIYLDLAGLVILHPFIVEFFAALKLTENNQFINEIFLHKAAQLLGYIATGTTEIEEQLLILPKLLCGMDLTAPIEKEIIISDEERHEVTELLNTVIAYWKAIKNTSPDGLRSSFLLRSGKLSPREGGWQLDVEQKTWDILLGKLPWGISIIKLPWMQEILYVNWQ